MSTLCVVLTHVVGLFCSVGLYYIEQQQLAVATAVLQVVALLVQWGGDGKSSAADKFLNKMPTTCVLPNGLEISQWAQGETDFLYTEIFESVSQSKTGENNSYVSHGLELGPGATVFDVGANIGMTTLFLAKNHLSGESGDSVGTLRGSSGSEVGGAAVLSAMTVGALRDELRSRGLKVSGRKAELVARLCEASGSGGLDGGDDDWLPLSRVFCFEPVPAIHRVLARNADMISTRYSADGDDAAELAGHVDVVALNVGLSDSPGTTTFDWHPNMSLWSTGDTSFGESRLARWREDMPSSIAKKQSDGELPAWLACLPSALKVWLGNKMLDAISVTIPITATLKTISQIIEEHDVSVINLLKVDVEGLEMQVLEGIQTEAHWEMVQQVVMEVEDYELLTRITELLETQGFDVQVRKGLEMEEHGAASSEVTHLWARRL